MSHFHPFPLHIHFHMDFHSIEGLYNKHTTQTQEAVVLLYCYGEGDEKVVRRNDVYVKPKRKLDLNGRKL